MNAVITKRTTIDTLTADQYKYIETAVTVDELKKEFIQKTNIEEFDLEEVKKIWLSNKTEATKQTYNFALTFFLENSQMHPLLYTYKEATNFISFVNSTHLSGNTKSVLVACISSFFTTLFMLEKIMMNPFVNHRNAMPKAERSKELLVPTEEEFDIILASFYDDLRGSEIKKKDAAKHMIAVLLIMKENGLRVGAFNEVFTIGALGFFETMSKGKKIRGKLSEKVLTFIDSYDIIISRLHSRSIQKNFDRRVRKLYEAGVIAGTYSCHDIRHMFAVTTYLNTGDIYKVSKKLYHSSIEITKKYLESLDVIVE